MRKLITWLVLASFVFATIVWSIPSHAQWGWGPRYGYGYGYPVIVPIPVPVPVPVYPYGYYQVYPRYSNPYPMSPLCQQAPVFDYTGRRVIGSQTVCP